jgi:hypothetical protein
MPCYDSRDDENSPENKSVRLANLYLYVCKRTGTAYGHWVNEVIADYGHPHRIDQLTQMLCDMIKSFTPIMLENIVYDAHCPQSRELAGWWEKHQVDDARNEMLESINAHDPNEFDDREEFVCFTASEESVIIDLEWYRRATKILP